MPVNKKSNFLNLKLKKIKKKLETRLDRQRGHSLVLRSKTTLFSRVNHNCL